ncbi:MAG: hypothetical protein ACKVQV_08360 [Bacteroidia bacterium]
MKTISINRIIFTFLLISLVCSCKKDKTNEPIPINQSELITKVQLVFKDSITSNIVQIATFSDLDGPGGNVATIDSILLASNTTYYMELVVLDETKTPLDTISNEVLDEGDVHLFVFSPNPSANFIETTILDMDINFKPIGLSSILHTSNIGLGTYTVELRHFDSEVAKAANITFDTDVSITFDVRLQ